MIRRVTCLTILAIVAALVASFAFAKFPQDFTTTHYRVAMSRDALLPAEMVGPGIGMSDFLYRGAAYAEIDLVGNYLFVTGTFGDLTGQFLPEVANGIHIHHDPALYHLDTIVAGIANEGLDMGTFEDAVYLTPEQQQMLVEGRLYMDIHTTAYPGGEVRGMIVAVPELPLVAAR
ncbi:MAG: CHRD domain-containing protein [Deinococcales bacterium]